MPSNPQDPLSTADFPLPADDNVANFIDFAQDDEPADPNERIYDFSEISSFYTDQADDSVDVSDDDTLDSSTLGFPPDPSYVNIYSDNQASGFFYNKYEIATAYRRDYGQRQQAICGPAGTPPEEVRVHGGRQIKIICWIAERWGTWPVLPHHSTGVPGDTLAFSDITPDAPQPVGDGYSLAYRVSGTYIYHCAYFNADTDPLNACTTDVINVPAVENVVPFGQFSSTLLQGLAPAGPFGAIAP